jgi:hypothetical protein
MKFVGLEPTLRSGGAASGPRDPTGGFFRFPALLSWSYQLPDQRRALRVLTRQSAVLLATRCSDADAEFCG